MFNRELESLASGTGTQAVEGLTPLRQLFAEVGVTSIIPTAEVEGRQTKLLQKWRAQYWLPQETHPRLAAWAFRKRSSSILLVNCLVWWLGGEDGFGEAAKGHWTSFEYSDRAAANFWMPVGLQNQARTLMRRGVQVSFDYFDKDPDIFAVLGDEKLYFGHWDIPVGAHGYSMKGA